MFHRNSTMVFVSRTFATIKHYRATTSLRNNDSKRVRRYRQEDLIGMVLENATINQPQDWNKIRDTILNHELNKYNIYNTENIDGMIMGFCVSRLKRIDWAKFYLQYLKEKNVTPNLVIMGNHLKMLYESNLKKVSREDEKQIIELCENIKKNYPVLDSITQENMIMALSVTKDWKKCLELLQEIKVTTIPSIQTYSSLISAAFLKKENQLAWDLLREMLQHKLMPLNITFLSYLRSLKSLKRRDVIVQRLETLFQFFRQSELICQEEVAERILDFTQISGVKTTVKFSGQCVSCNNNLEKFELTENEFSELKEVFFKNVLVGRDIFIKTDPSELEEFQHFISKMGKFDVVLDGLNIAYSAGIKKGPHIFSELLVSVISHFVEQNKSVLMLGRKHMIKWPKYSWNYITENSSVFLAKNISQDDPYLLYCALHSGRDTIIVTRDLMRSHRHLLKESKYKILFDRWLSQRQYFLLYVNDENKAIFRRPPHFSAISQKNEQFWHIPFSLEVDNSVNEKYQKTWLCLDCSR